METHLASRGKLAASKRKTLRKAPLGWRLRNTLRGSYLWGWLCDRLAVWFSRLTGIRTIRSRLGAVKRLADGTKIDYGIIGYREVTDAGVAFLVDDWTNDATDITDFDYHACGTDNTAEDQTDTALGAEETTSTSRQVGTPTQPSANVLKSTATQNFTGSVAVVEHGLLSAVSAGTLWDRTVFAVINVADGESITWEYSITFTAGG
jgi:hypothetical protein